MEDISKENGIVLCYEIDSSLNPTMNSAHFLYELSVDFPVKKRVNCKQFFGDGYCVLGPYCNYLHEHRVIDQIRRYPNVVKLIKYERTYAMIPDKSKFIINTLDKSVKRLPVFELICAEEFVSKTIPMKLKQDSENEEGISSSSSTNES